MSKLRGEGGANAVEFALVLPLLIVLIFGIAWGAIAYNRQLTLTQAARESARFGATLAVDVDDAGEVAAWRSSVEDRARDVAQGQLDMPGADICVFLEIDGVTVVNTHGGPCLSSGSLSGSRVEVETRAPARIEAVFVNSVLDLRGTSAARYERGGA